MAMAYIEQSHSTARKPSGRVEGRSLGLSDPEIIDHLDEGGQCEQAKGKWYPPAQRWMT